MPIVSGDIDFRLSTKSGSAGDSLASTPAASLGKYVATTEITNATGENLFDDASGAENTAQDIEYRCFFVLNNHGTLTLSGAVAWLSAEVQGGAVVAIGLDPAGVVAKGSASAQAAEIATEGDAPTGVTFSSPTDKGSGLSIGNIGPGQVQAIWMRRTCTNSAALSGDGATVRVEGDTPA